MSDQAPDPEIQRQNSDATEANTRARDAETKKILEMIAVMATMASSVGGSSAKSKEASDALNRLRKATDDQTEAEKAHAAAKEESAKKQSNYDSAIASSKDALKSFAGAMTNTSTEFSKFNGTLNSAGDAALSIGKNFGILGLIIGGLIKGATVAAEMMTKQADNALKATDEMSKMGGAGAHTAKSVAEMATKIGLSNEQWGLMTNAMKRANTGMAGLGSTAGEGQKAFGNMLAVTNQQREAFQRLGVSQEELMNQQADYVKLQEMSGKSLASQAKDGDALRRESLAYAENLSRLSALTGKSADKIAKEQEAAMLEYEEIVATRIEDDKIRKLKAEGREKEAAGLQQEQDARKAYIKQVTTQLGKEAGLQVGKVARTGAFDSSTSGLAALGISAQDVQKGFKGKTAKEAEQGAADFTQQIKEKQSEKLGQLGTSLQFGGEALGKQFFLGKESLQETGKFMERNEGQANKEAGARTAGAAEGSKTAGGVAAEDPAQISRNAATTATIELNKTLEKMLMESNPLLSGFNKLTIAMTALTAAAGAIALILGAKALKGGAGDVLSKIGGIGGKATTVAEGAAGAASKAGGAMKVLGTAGKVLGKVAAPLAIASAGYDAYKGYNKAEETLGIKDRKATTGEKLASAAGGAISGLTFGLVSSETISKGIAKATGAGPDEKAKEEKVQEAQLAADKENTETTKKLDSSTAALIRALDTLRVSVDVLATKITGGIPGGAPAVPGAQPAPGAQPTPGVQPAPGAAQMPPVTQDIQKNLNDMAEAMKKRGMTDPEYIKATLGNVMKESGGKMVNENLDYSGTSNDRIKKIFGSRATGKTEEQLNAIKKDPQQMGEMMYGKDTEIGRGMGNTEIGDGYKYRGRGFIGITGKALYSQCSQAIFGDDRLVKNPDLINDPKVAAEAAAWYMEKTRGNMARKMGIDLTKKLDKEAAAQLATSQIAGRDVNKASDYIKGELMGKVRKYADTDAVAKAASGGGTPAVAGPPGGPAPGGGTPAVATTSEAGSATSRSVASKGGPEQGHAAESGGGAEGGGAPKLARVTSKTGKAAQVNEKFAPAFQGLIDYLDKVGYEINSLGGYIDRDVRGMPGVKSVHAHGGAIDINPTTNPLSSTLVTDMPEDISSVAAGLGLGWGGNWKSRKDAMHFSAALNEGGTLLKAKEGGLFDGPSSGYDVELHGREAVVPLPNPESIINVEEKSSADKEPLNTVMENNTQSTNTMDSAVIMDLIQMLSDKLDDVIDVLEDGNNTSNKILQYSQV